MAKIIAITGKGGTGKTTVAALIIKYLKEHASGPILALDADPDANLATVIGIPVEKTIGELREQTLKEIKELPAGMDKRSYIEAGLHQIIVETEKLDLVTMGRSEGPGCYCYINSLLRKFADDIQANYQWVVMDNEAGLEHLSRRTASHVDHLITVVNADPLSIDCAKRIAKLIGDVKNDVRNQYILLNNVSGDDRVEWAKHKADELEMEFLGCIPRDPVIEEAIFNGRSLFDVADSPAVQAVDAMMEKMCADG